MKKDILGLCCSFPKALKNLTSYTNPYYTVFFKSRVLSVFPSSSDASTHFHIETPSCRHLCIPPLYPCIPLFIIHQWRKWRKWRVVTFAWLPKFSPLFVLSKTFGSGELVKMEELQKKYVIKSFNSKSSRQKKLKFEEIDLSVCKSSAKCTAFVTSEHRILFWVKALQQSYFDLLEDNDDYHIKWIDHLNSDDTGFEHIEMKVSHFTAVPDNRTTLFTITTYLTTGVVMCQGVSFELWCSNEFPRLKEKTEH